MDMMGGEKDLSSQTSCWVPQTPVKPNSKIQRPICSQGGGNQLGYGFDSDDMNKGWEGSGGLGFANRFPVEFEGSGHLNFGELMALADSAAAWRTDSLDLNGAGPSNPIFDTHFGASSSNSWNMGSTGREMFGSCAPAAAASYGNGVPFQYDLNSPTTALTDMNLGGNIPFQFAPVTPDQLGKPQNYQNNSIHTNLNQIPAQERVEVGNEVANMTNQVQNAVSTEQQQLQNAVSTGLQEDHNPDFDLNKTPQQKPRRRKHRPKVVIEGKAKRSPKPPKTPAPKENPTGKRKYVRKNPHNKTPSKPVSDIASGSSDPKASQETTTSCKRALNFNFEGQLQEEFPLYGTRYRGNAQSPVENRCDRVISQSVVQLGQGMEAVVEKTQVGIAHDLNRANKSFLEDYLSMPQAQASSPSIPNKTHLEPGSWKPCGQSEMPRKGRVLSGDSQTVPRSPNYSNCSSSATVAEGEHAKRLKRGPLYVTEQDRTNVIGGYFNSLSKYASIIPESVSENTITSSIHFSRVQKKKRSQERYNATTSSILNVATPAVNGEKPAMASPPSNARADVSTSGSICGAPALQLNIGSSQTFGVPGMDAQSCQQKTPGCNIAPVEKVRKPRKTSKRLPTIPVGPATAYGEMQVYKMSSHPQTNMEGMLMEPRRRMTSKKRTKRNPSSVYTDAMQRQISSVDEIAEYLKLLDINRESNGVMFQDLHALIPYNRRYGEQNALVLYQKDGTMVPFEGPFDPIRKRKSRPKVDLDDETTRVWRLLLENINNEGIDGTDEEKAKWWEEERRVFRGRADSFIARMHLVQGDRRFSPWKGSVVDSVVGVFLTQNVSDHLSSSAFMSLAARFPLKSDNENSCFEEPNVIIEEPEECPEQLDYQRTSVELHERVCSTEKEAEDSNEILGSVSDGVRSTGNSKCQSPETVEISQISTAGKEMVQPTEPVENLLGEKVMDDMLSSQDSSFSFVESSIAQSTDPSSVSSSSFIELLRAEHLRGLKSRETENGSLYEEASECCGKTQDKDASDKSTTSLRPMMPPNNCPGSFDLLFAEASRSSDLSKKGQQNCPSEQSEVTAESVGHATLVESTSLIGKNAEHHAAESSLTEHRHPATGQEINETHSDISRRKSSKTVKPKVNPVDWDGLRVQAQEAKGKRAKTANTLDSLDWEAVRCANVNEIADAIKERGMNNMLAERIQAFLNRLVEKHGGIDLEWLRDVPPDKAKEYLLSIRGLGLKSVECVRLLTLHHLAFPVDTNVGRIAVRLGWVPLQPLPESLQLHLLELYPVMESIQKYLWPRLCKLDQRTLYELHYQMITFGKVFCTKSKPNCNACPMRGECRHFASAFASARLALPGPAEKSIVTASNGKATNQNGANVPTPSQPPLPLPLPPQVGDEQVKAHNENSNRGLIVEVATTPFSSVEVPATPAAPSVEMPASPGPIIEVPASPEPSEIRVLDSDIEDAFAEDPDEIPLIRLNIEELTQNLQNYMQHNMELQEGDMNRALVALTPEAASLPTPRLKNVSRLRTEHQVYELPDSHPLLEGMERRDRDDPCSYLLAIWTPGETPTSIQPPEERCRRQESGELCESSTCFSCNSIREANSQIVRGTILIPCRTAMRGSFPLNGTYFQVNEVFADHASSIRPIEVPRQWIWNLPRRTVYFGTSVTSIFKGLSTESIQLCFWRGFVCVRGFDVQSRAPRPLLARLHFPASRLKETAKGKAAAQNQE